MRGHRLRVLKRAALDLDGVPPLHAVAERAAAFSGETVSARHRWRGGSQDGGGSVT